VLCRDPIFLRVLTMGRLRRVVSTSGSIETLAPPHKKCPPPVKKLRKRRFFHTLKRVDAPFWLTDNAYILSGYRQINNSYYRCILSLFYLHNELINVYTHLIGTLACLCLYLLDELSIHATTSSYDRLALLCFLSGAGIDAF
jgi:hypothetical protein